MRSVTVGRGNDDVIVFSKGQVDVDGMKELLDKDPAMLLCRLYRRDLYQGLSSILHLYIVFSRVDTLVDA